MNISICTLFEGNYHFGLAALANSLAAGGYRGNLWVGYRGALPDWLTGSKDYDRAAGRLQVTPDLQVRMVELATPMHFTFYKPTFIREVFEKHEPSADVVAYLDPDIVVKCEWAAMEGFFTADGIALIEDVNWAFPERHPKRLLWQRFFAPHGAQPVRQLGRYYNGGFIGVSRAHFDFLQCWSGLCELIVARSKDKQQIKTGGPTELFHSTDQDALNYALTMFDTPLNTAGPESMDFMPGGYYLSHAIGSKKPWHGNHLKQALRGFPPSTAAKSYYEFADAPLDPYPPGLLKRRKLSLRLAAAVGRFYKKA